MDQQPRKQNNEFVPLDDNSAPIYDRGYALGLTSDKGTSNMERQTLGFLVVDILATRLIWSNYCCFVLLLKYCFYLNMLFVLVRLLIELYLVN